MSEWQDPESTKPTDKDDILVITGDYRGCGGNPAVAYYDSERDSYFFGNGSYSPTELFPHKLGSNAIVVLAWREIDSWDGEFEV